MRKTMAQLAGVIILTITLAACGEMESNSFEFKSAEQKSFDDNHSKLAKEYWTNVSEAISNGKLKTGTREHEELVGKYQKPYDEFWNKNRLNVVMNKGQTPRKLTGWACTISDNLGSDYRDGTDGGEKLVDVPVCITASVKSCSNLPNKFRLVFSGQLSNNMPKKLYNDDVIRFTGIATHLEGPGITCGEYSVQAKVDAIEIIKQGK